MDLPRGVKVVEITNVYECPLCHQQVVISSELQDTDISEIAAMFRSGQKIQIMGLLIAPVATV
jgi:hypothetical protein